VLIETVSAGRYRGLASEYVRIEGPADQKAIPGQLRGVRMGRAVAGRLQESRLLPVGGRDALPSGR
jgi:hypothetical protein